MNDRFWKIIIRTVLWSIPAYLILIFISNYFAFSGVFVAEKFSPKPSPFISRLFPPENVSDNGKEIIASPVFFDVRIPPISFEKVTVLLTYENIGNQPIELGARYKSVPQTWHYEFFLLPSSEGVHTAALVFDVPGLMVDKGNLHFALREMPTTNAELNIHVRVVAIKVVLERKQLL